MNAQSGCSNGRGRPSRFSAPIVTLVLVCLIWGGTGIAPQLNRAAFASSPVFSEDFESGGTGWTMTGMWHAQDHPESISVLSPDINANLVTLPDSGQLPAAFGGTQAAWFGEAATGTYCGSDFGSITQSAKGGCASTGAESGELTSPVFSLEDASNATLSFESWWEIEGVDPSGFDLMTVQYTTDGGSSWNPVGELNPTAGGGGTSDEPYTVNGLGQVGAWTHYLFDLSAAAGQSAVQIRFSFDTGDFNFNGFRGWLVDDVSVTPDALPPPSVAITAPADSAVLAASVDHTFSADASPAAGSAVTSVEFKVDGATIATDTTAPYSTTLDAGSLSAGSHQLTAVAHDATGTSASDQINVNVAAEPTVSIVPPAGFTVLNASSTFTASVGASSPATVTGVHFVLDGVTDLGTDTTAPYQATLDPAALFLPADTYSLTATVSDSLGQTATDMFEFAVPTATLSVSSARPGGSPFQVTPGGDAAWVVTVANSSAFVAHHVTLEAAANGKKTSVVQLAWDEASIDEANASPNGIDACQAAGSGITCHLPDVPAHSSVAFAIYARTNGQPSGAVVSGTFQAEATNATAKSGTLDNWNVVTLTDGIITLAAPGVPNQVFTGVSATHPANVTLVLSRATINALTGQYQPGWLRWRAALGPAVAATTGPRIELQVVNASTVPAFCQNSCAGLKLAELTGDYSLSTQTAPALAILTTRFVGSVKPGKVYLVKPNGKLTPALKLCTRNAAGAFPTPCLNGPEIVRIGPKTSDGKPSFIVTDLVFFSGKDPGVGRR